MILSDNYAVVHDAMNTIRYCNSYPAITSIIIYTNYTDTARG